MECSNDHSRWDDWLDLTLCYEKGQYMIFYDHEEEEHVLYKKNSEIDELNPHLGYKTNTRDNGKVRCIEIMSVNTTTGREVGKRVEGLNNNKLNSVITHLL